MDSESAKSKPLSKEETRMLIELISASKIITNKKTNATTNKMKVEEWDRIATSFNATATQYPRSSQQLRLKWENLKKNTRKRNAKIRMNQIKTGGGAGEYIPPDELLDRVSSLLGTTGSGFEVPYGGDSEPGGDIDGLMEGEARVNIEFLNAPIPEENVPNNLMLPSSSSEQQNVVQDGPSGVCGHGSSALIADAGHNTPRARPALTPSSGKKRQTKDGAKNAKDLAIAEYFKMKKQCLGEKLKYLELTNEKLKLENEKLRMELENMKK